MAVIEAGMAMQLVQRLGESSDELLSAYNSKTEKHFVWLDEVQEQILEEKKTLSPGGGRSTMALPETPSQNKRRPKRKKTVARKDQTENMGAPDKKSRTKKAPSAKPKPLAAVTNKAPSRTTRRSQAAVQPTAASTRPRRSTRGRVSPSSPPPSRDDATPEPLPEAEDEEPATPMNMPTRSGTPDTLMHAPNTPDTVVRGATPTTPQPKENLTPDTVVKATRSAAGNKLPTPRAQASVKKKGLPNKANSVSGYAKKLEEKVRANTTPSTEGGMQQQAKTPGQIKMPAAYRAGRQTRGSVQSAVQRFELLSPKSASGNASSPTASPRAGRSLKSKLTSSNVRSEKPLRERASAEKKRKSSPTAGTKSAGKRRMTDPESDGAEDADDAVAPLDHTAKKDMVRLNRQRNQSRRKPSRKGTYTKSTTAPVAATAVEPETETETETENEATDEATVVAVPRPAKSTASKAKASWLSKGPLTNSRLLKKDPGTPSRVGSLAANFERGVDSKMKGKPARPKVVTGAASSAFGSRKVVEKSKPGTSKPIAALERARRLKVAQQEKEAQRAANKAERVKNKKEREAIANLEKAKIEKELEATRDSMRKQRAMKDEKLKAEQLKKKAEEQDRRERTKRRMAAADQKRKEKEDQTKVEREKKKVAAAELKRKEEAVRKQKQEDDRIRKRQLEAERKQKEQAEAERKQQEAEAADAARKQELATQAAADRVKKIEQATADRAKKQKEIRAKQEAHREEMRKIQEAKKQLELKKRQLKERMDLAVRKQAERIKVPTIPGVSGAPKSPEQLQSYDMSHLDSDASTDEEDAPRSEVPVWASGKALRTALYQQYIHDGSHIFDNVPDPDLEEIFPPKNGKSRIRARTSSAMWSPSPTKGNGPHKRI